jgi:hypothetical protein
MNHRLGSSIAKEDFDMGQPSRDSVVELLHACRHSLRFALGGPLGHPDAPAPPDEQFPPPALFERLMVVSPPPSRDGEHWRAGLTLGGRPFEPDPTSTRLAEVEHEAGIPSLDAADPGTIILDEVVTIERRPTKMSFPGPDEGRYLLSIGYWSVIPPGATHTIKEVQYYGEYERTWTREPEGDWVALSLDAFWPPERDSADLIIPLRCTDACPRT